MHLAIGVLLGLGFAAVLSSGLGAMLFGVKPWDPVVFAVVVVTLSLSGSAAFLIPARRATRVDPIDALRMTLDLAVSPAVSGIHDEPRAHPEQQAQPRLARQT